MANDVTWDVSDLEAKATALIAKAKKNTLQAVNDVSTTILALSQIEVPHDMGTLQNSGSTIPATDQDNPVAVVGYNTVYAAYQHEGQRIDGSHVIRHYQDGRKGKYLEDPIKNNLTVFRNYFLKVLS